MDPKELFCDGLDEICLAQDRVQLWDLVNTVMNIKVT
jgi:hypothetical protein